MNYFTPERYVAFNSPNDDVADRADDDWERAIVAYRRHLKRIQPQLPAKVRELAKDICFHDAEYLGMSKISIPGHTGDLAILSIRHDEKVHVLTYLLVAEPLVSRPVEAAVFKTNEPHWLYDEFGIDESGALTHQILISDGRVVSLRFVALDWLTQLPHTPVRKKGRRALVTV